MTSPVSTPPITVFSEEEGTGLAARVRALPALDAAALETAVGDVLVDAWVPGAPLLITFAFVNWERPADFYLFGRSRKLEQLSGRRFNRILLRDRRNLWYLDGVPGLGDSLTGTITRLKQLIDAIAPSEVWCVGESMGGYAALLYGIALGASRIVAFGPLSTFSPEFAQAYGDFRWHSVMATVAAMHPSTATDLPVLARRHGHSKPIHLIAGTSAGPQASDAVNLDVMHAQRFTDLPGVTCHYYPKAEHAVTQWLATNGLLDSVLLHCLCDEPLPADSSDALFASPLLRRESTAAPAPEPFIEGRTTGAPLLVCFATATDDLFTDPFLEECAQLALLHGGAINRLIVRNPLRRDWIMSPDSLVVRLRGMIAALAPRRVVCLGSGLGGYAALLFGALLKADRILAFNPLSTLDTKLAALWHDRRYEPNEGPDLLPILAQYSGRIYIACGIADAGVESEICTHDAVHAQRLSVLDNVLVQPWPASGSLVCWMRDRKLLLGFLSYCGFGPDRRSGSG